ncbi:hypothetical protein [Gluconobacter sphaericus]|uniref:hypothetical protein n=1 Tax=Gluconobacter sphaericus TaxID=574987 RepID=UPI001B8ACB28|nr:hypothetical protein [Gluconobacter sphaericus]MBS1087237.1 hypothetical protein [Gluconobacter sphaericus]MBS1101268.1 hypothetical protein [Gluconobacter sphaericus]
MPDSIGWKLLAVAFAATMLIAAPAEAWPWIYAGPPIVVPPPVLVAPLAVSWGGRKLHQLMVIADCPLRSLANGGLYVRDEGDYSPSALLLMSRQAV